MKTTTRYRVEIMNRMGKINGRLCAVGNDWIVVDKGPEGRHTNVVSHHGEDEQAARKWADYCNRSGVVGHNGVVTL